MHIAPECLPSLHLDSLEAQMWRAVYGALRDGEEGGDASAGRVYNASNAWMILTHWYRLCRHDDAR